MPVLNDAGAFGLYFYTVHYQVHLPAPEDVAGPADVYRRPLENVIVVAPNGNAETIMAVLQDRVHLEAGEQIQILQVVQQPPYLDGKVLIYR